MPIPSRRFKYIANHTKVDYSTSCLGHRVALDTDHDSLEVGSHDALDDVAKDGLDFGYQLARPHDLCDIFEHLTE